MTARPSPLLQLLASRYLDRRREALRATGDVWPAADRAREDAGEALSLELDAPGAPLSFVHDGFKFHLDKPDRQLVVSPTGRALRVGDYRGLTAVHGAWEAST